jgi:hypothetical protein
MCRSISVDPAKARLRFPGRAFFLLMAAPISLVAQNPFFVQVTDTFAINPNEVSVVINPLNPEHFTAVSMQFRRPDGDAAISNWVYNSTDNGKTWNTRPLQNLQNRVQGDDAITVSAGGLMARSYISFDGIRVKQPKVARNGIFVSTSTNGNEWTAPVAAIDHINTVRPFEDKPWPAFDIGKTSAGKGRLMVSWTRFDEYGSTLPGDSTHIYFTVSEDSGRTFRPPFRISDVAGNCLDDGNTVEGAVPAAGPDGTIYVAWSGPKGIVIDRSSDSGKTFGRDIKVTDHVGGWEFGVKNLDRHNGMPILKTDVSGGAFHGSLYIAFMDRRFGDPDVFLTASRDGGVTWTEPIRVNTDQRGNGLDQAFAWLAVDPVDGSVNLVYYDRAANKEGLVGVTLSRSIDGGRSFKHFNVEVPPFEFEKGVFFGDYIGIDASGGKVVTVFTHFKESKRLALRAGIFTFEPGSVKLKKSR